MSENIIAAANTRFALRLFAELVNHQPQDNVFISPLSIAQALTMVYNGAAETTRDAIAGALGVAEMTSDAVNAANAQLIQRLDELDPHAADMLLFGKLDVEVRVKLTIANSLWLRTGVPLLADFVERCRETYRAEIASLDFEAPDAPATINQWVSRQTGGKIDQIITELQSQDVLLLLNAVYFKGAWDSPFDASDTAEGVFTLLDGSPKTCPMMGQSAHFAYSADDEAEVVSLPFFADGRPWNERAHMVIALPRPHRSLAAFCAGLNAEWWRDRVATRRPPSYGTVVLPRFTLSYAVNLKDALQALGMGVAFSDKTANFNGISPLPLWIGQALHKTTLMVDETGCEASAATDASMMTLGVPPQEEFVMRIDRPFFCSIVETQTGMPIFLGAVVEP